MYSRFRHSRRDQRNFVGRPKKRQSICHANVKKKSASAQKLISYDYPEVNFEGYRIFDMRLLFESLEKFLLCKCGGTVKFFEIRLSGLVGTYLIVCDKCKSENVFSSSRKIGKNSNVFEVNRRSVLAMRMTGGGLSSLNTFCCIMDLPHPVRKTTYNKIKQQIWNSSRETAQQIMRQSVEEEVNLTVKNTVHQEEPKETEQTLDSDHAQVLDVESNSESTGGSSQPETSAREIGISGDGTWQRKGFQSLNGVCTVLGLETGKVLDIEVLSSYCSECNKWEKVNGTDNTDEWQKWYSIHLPACSKNHFGSSGSMEPSGMLEIFQRSVEQYDVMYTTYLGDGDSSTFSYIQKAQPYGKKVTISKKECCGHIQKRFGTQMRKLNKSKVLSDGKKLGGKGRFTDKIIDEMKSYYGNAIREHSDSVENMYKAIWAIYFHKGSTDSNPQHHLCPPGPDSWCKFQKAVANGTEDQYKHSKELAPAILEEIKVVFENLSNPDLLRKCLGGRTQNANESFNNVLWNFAPKNKYVALQSLEIASYLACITFVTGYKGILCLMENLSVIPGKNALEAAVKIDQRRIKDAEVKMSHSTKEARRLKRKLKIPDDTYLPGGH